MNSNQLQEVVTKEVERVVGRYVRTYKDFEINFKIEVIDLRTPKTVKVESDSESEEEKKVELTVLDIIKPSEAVEEPVRTERVIKTRLRRYKDDNGKEWTSDKVKLKADFMRYQYKRYKDQCEEVGRKPDYHKDFMKLVTPVYKTLTDEEKVNNDTIQWVV